MALKGIKVIEMAGLAPVPFCGQILRDFGAKVTRVDNVFNPLETVSMFKYGKDTIKLNLKSKDGSNILRRIVQEDQIDVFLDPFRPGVLEKLNLGPEILMDLNPRLVYTRLSGFGQTGPMKFAAGHDINYVALSGVLSFLGAKDAPPKPPVNLLADFAGGSVLCSLGIMMALFERSTSGKGQVIDHSMTEGTAYISSFLFETLKHGKNFVWSNHPERSSNLLDTGAPFYRCYETKDGKYMAVGSIEVKFYDNLLRIIDFQDPEDKYSQFDTTLWPEMSEKFEQIFKTKTRNEWTALFDNQDACVTPVLDVDEVANFQQHKERDVMLNGVPNPAPRMSRTPAKRVEDVADETSTDSVLQRLGYKPEEIAAFKEDGVVA